MSLNPVRVRGADLPASLLAAVIVAAIAAFSPHLFNDSDTWMHIAAGEVMIRHGAVLHSDPFSYTFAGGPWQTHEWLAEVVMAQVYRIGGWASEALLFAAAAGATAGLLVRHLGRWLCSRPIDLTVVAVVSLAMLAPALLARPHVLAWPFLEMWTAELVIARFEKRTPSWARLAPIMVVWANLHGSFLFGLGLLGAFGLEAIWRNRRDGVNALLPWLWLVPLMFGAGIVSPHGIDNLLFPFHLIGMSTLPSVVEWSPMDFSRNPAFELALLASMFWFGAKGVRAPVFSLLLVLLLAHLTLHQTRYVQLFALVTPLVLAEPLGEGSGRAVVRKLWGGGAVATGSAFAVVIAAARIALAPSPGNSAVAPSAALDHVQAAVRREPVFNAYGMGGYLIFEGVRPYIDSRVEVYGDAFRRRFMRIAGGDICAFLQEAAARRFAWTILEPASPLVPLLDHSPDWDRIYVDGNAIVHLHRGSVWSPPPAWCGPEAQASAT